MCIQGRHVPICLMCTEGRFGPATRPVGSGIAAVGSSPAAVTLDKLGVAGSSQFRPLRDAGNDVSLLPTQSALTRRSACKTHRWASRAPVSRHGCAFWAESA